MKRYQVQGLAVVGICVAIGVILGLALLIGRAAVGSRQSQDMAQQTAPVQSTARARGQEQPDASMPGSSTPATPDFQAQSAPQPAVEDIGAPAATDLQERAARFAADYFESWSGSDADALAFIDRHYAPTVRFYGNSKSRSEIAQMKYDFVRRWPERSYRPDPAQMQIACDAARAACLVSGVVFYSTRSAERNASSSGSATFEMGVQWSGGEFQIISENGRVLAQQRTQ